MTSKQIDYVFPYVSMDDKVWQKSYEKHVGGTINKCRYRDNGLLKYKIAGLKKYMPWARIVMLVSSESQVPSWIDRKEVNIITHDKFIPKEFLPTFSSCTIEMFLHNIPDLSEYFIYSNDDFYITSPMKLTDFVTTKAKLLFNTISNPSKTLFNSTMRNQWDFIARKYNRPLTLPEVRPAHIDSVMQKSFNKKIYDKWKNEIHQHIFKTRNINAFNQYFWLLCMYLENNYIQSTVSYMYANMTSAISADKMSKYNIVALNDNSKVSDEDISKVKIVLEDFYFPKPPKVIQKPIIAQQKPAIEGNKISSAVMPAAKGSRSRVALCATAKNENKYIREWVEYYLGIGVSKIFLYDNNDVDGEQFETVIGDYISSKHVTVLNRRGAIIDIRKGKYKLNLQDLLYAECYEHHKDDFDWMMFLDIDEFLTSPSKLNIIDYINSNRFREYDTILINWEYYGDNGNVKYEDAPVMRRFTKKCNMPGINKGFRSGFQCKSIVRCGKKHINYEGNIPIHKFLVEGCKVCNSNGQQVSELASPKISNNCFENLVVNHYITKTIEEYLHRYVGRINSVSKTGEKFNINQVVNNFFLFNEVTQEKLKVIEKYKSML